MSETIPPPAASPSPSPSLPAPVVEYRVDLGERHRHLYRVEARLPSVGPTLDLRLPVWTPGSYLVREYERHVQDLACTDDEGRPLAVRKVDKATWRVEVGEARAVRARYRVYGHELTVRTSHLDDTHAYWNGATLLLYADAHRAAPARVVVTLPEGWHVSTGLAAEAGTNASDAGAGAEREARFLAPDYDALVDSPFEVGTHERHTFEVEGRAHELAIWGASDIDRERLVADTRRIVEAQAALFGGLPYDRYVFILHFSPGAHGGLEHRNSCTLLASPFAHRKPDKYLDLLELISHEFFHVWNVKRIHPAALSPPFDYSRESYTRSLWVVEGWTSYFDRLVLRRAGLMKPERYLEKLAEELAKTAGIAGQRHQSLEESSFDAWIKLYRPDENTNNTTISYYLKGSIAALLLDLEIRRRTAGARSLEDALLALWRDYGRAGIGYPDEQVQAIVERAAGVSLDDFFARSVRGREELDVDGPLASVGLRVKPAEDDEAKAAAGKQESGEGQDKPESQEKQKKQEKPGKGRKGAWMGAIVDKQMKITEVSEDGPGLAAGLSPGDEVIAVDGWRVDEEGLKEFVAAATPGQAVRVTIARRGRLRELEVTLTPRPPAMKLEIVPIDEAPEAARAAYQQWLGAAWPPETE